MQGRNAYLNLINNQMAMNNIFRLIAIRINGENSVGQRKLKSATLYYFMQGFSIEEDRVYVDRKINGRDSMYSDYFEDVQKTPHIHISAIVGENGAGKSTIVEYMMRLINNFAAATFGDIETKQKPYARLHYIDGIQGSLYYQKDDTIWELRVRNRNVQLIDYLRDEDVDEKECYILTNTPFWDNGDDDSIVTANSLHKMHRWIALPDIHEIYNNFFYSFVSNYSFYAYNTLDYEDENDYQLNVKEQLVHRKGDSYNWLHGLFHKNDGYQCPIVLSPYRDRGNIDINNENALSKERLISLLLQSSNNFSIINGHLQAKSFTLRLRTEKYDAHKLRKDSNGRQLYPRITKIGWHKYREIIPLIWMNRLHIHLDNVNLRNHADYAWDYITYKTLKIAAQYRQYTEFYDVHKHKDSKIDEERLKNYINDLVIDRSHITKKIRQTLAYIEYGMYEAGVLPQNQFTINIHNAADVEANRILKTERQKPTEDQYIHGIEDLVPPPIYVSKINLIDINTQSKVQFETLSSGEKQQAYTISSILYHLENLNSVHEDKNNRRLTYSHCNIILEELELYFHPELQKNLVRYLLDGIKQIPLTNIKAINICVVTHSPFVLSDIPKENILALNKEGGVRRDLYTFAANIHDMLKTSFLPSGTIGDFAQWLINRIVICLRVYDWLFNDSKTDFIIDDENQFVAQYYYNDELRNKTNFNRSKWEDKYTKDYIYNRISIIDEPIARHALLQEYSRIFGPLNKQQKIEEYKRKISELEKLK